MNEVFLLMWLADFMSNVGTVGLLSAFFWMIGVVMIGVVAGIGEGESKNLIKALKVTRIFLFLTCVAVLSPSKRTVDMMALAKATSVAAESKYGAKSLEALESFFDKIIKENKKGEVK